MIQKICEMLGAFGCYFFCILDLARETTGKLFNPAVEYLASTSAGEMGDDCFILNPAMILHRLTGKGVEFRKEGADYICGPGEYEVNRWEWQKAPMVTVGHFVRGDGKGATTFDPYGNSQTCANGKLVSKRIFKVV